MFNKINKSDKYGQTHREIVARCPVNSRKKQFKVKNRYELISKSWGSSPVLYPLPCENCEIIRWFLVYFLDRTGDGDLRAESEGLGDGSTNSWRSQKPRGLGWCFGTILKECSHPCSCLITSPFALYTSCSLTQHWVTRSLPSLYSTCTRWHDTGWRSWH